MILEVSIVPFSRSKEKVGANQARKLLRDLMHGVSEILDIAARDASHRDATVLGQEDAVVLGKLFHLISGHAGEAEHSDLVSNMLPVA